MTAYATRADIEIVYGQRHLETLVASDLDIDVAVARALALASAEIDLYLGQRYTLPLPRVPALLVGWCIDLACWRLAPSHLQITEEIRKRADRVMAMLRDIAAGKTRIDELEPPPGGGSGGGRGIPATETVEGSDAGAWFGANRRRFGGMGGGL
jgi:phage gp36-like protein